MSPHFNNRYEALQYWRAALQSEDSKLQSLIRYSLKRIHHIQDNIRWNESELKKEMEGRLSVIVDHPRSSILPNKTLTSFSQGDSAAAAESLLGLKSNINKKSEVRE